MSPQGLGLQTLLAPEHLTKSGCNLLGDESGTLIQNRQVVTVFAPLLCFPLDKCK